MFGPGQKFLPARTARHQQARPAVMSSQTDGQHAAASLRTLASTPVLMRASTSFELFFRLFRGPFGHADCVFLEQVVKRRPRDAQQFGGA